MRIYRAIKKIHKFQFPGIAGGGGVVRGFGLYGVKVTFLAFLGRKKKTFQEGKPVPGVSAARDIPVLRN